MTKLHVIKDESLGGIEREFIEVDRNAEVGDLVSYPGISAIYKVSRNPQKADDDCLMIIKSEHSDLVGNPAFTSDLANFIPLEPTDIVHVDELVHAETGLRGISRYRLVDRKAEVGEKVMHYYEGKSAGIITVALEIDNGEVDVAVDYDDTDGAQVVGIDHGAYFVLEPVTAAEPCCENHACEADALVTEAEAEASPQVIDMLANLSRRIVSLEAQLTATQRNVETLAQEFESVKITANTAESNLDDLATRQRDHLVRLNRLGEDVKRTIEDITALNEQTIGEPTFTQAQVAAIIQALGGVDR